jgi:hypothetical protein
MAEGGSANFPFDTRLTELMIRWRRRFQLLCPHLDFLCELERLPVSQGGGHVVTYTWSYGHVIQVVSNHLYGHVVQVLKM